jgi:alpha-aminoadipic semialdehyde synthase
VTELSGRTDLVLGIKEAPVSEVQKLLGKEKGKKRTWMMFSHTHKGQVCACACLFGCVELMKT